MSRLTAAQKKDMNFSMRLSFVVGVVILLIKLYAYSITKSTAILSDATESVIHIIAVGFSAYSMWLSLKPPDTDHLYGHEKVGFFSAGFEGAMIIFAALFIIYESITKIIYGFTVENINAGLWFIVSVIIINFALAFYLIQKGKRYKSIVLEANGKHILTDCITSFCVIAALLLVKMTGILLFDPLIAMVAAANILLTGSKLIKRSIGGLMDKADVKTQIRISTLLEKETAKKNLEFHNLRHRQAGQKLFIEFHLLFPKNVSLAEAHHMATEIESHLHRSLDTDVDILTHLEPKEHHDQIHTKYGLPI